jgi:hypothetical protein
METSVNQGLVVCLVLSVMTGGAAAGLALATGWGWLAALLGYSLTGSTTLVAATLALRPAEPRPVLLAVAEARGIGAGLSVTARSG